MPKRRARYCVPWSMRTSCKPCRAAAICSSMPMCWSSCAASPVNMSWAWLPYCRRVADDGQALLFEYSPEALAQGLELSPLHLKLRADAYGSFPTHLHRLPGLIADSLPDGWGLLLMDRLFRQTGLRHPGPLDRLAFIGERAMGALRFVPASDAGAREPDWSLLALAEQSRLALAGE